MLTSVKSVNIGQVKWLQ